MGKRPCPGLGVGRTSAKPRGFGAARQGRRASLGDPSTPELQLRASPTFRRLRALAGLIQAYL
eukprot:13902010-Alexandrium_andersonii.AAC.1